MRVLIAGAGPTGLTAAIELARRGVEVRIVEKRAEGSGLSRAVGIMPKSLELLADSGVAERLLAEGIRMAHFQIFLDGRKHPEDPDPTWYGHSIGTWEGDTLVIDTVGFNDRFWFDFAGHPHTEKLHTIERYRRPDFNTLEYDITIDDPGAYTKPFVLHARSTYEPDTELMEYICNENNTNVPHIVGPARAPGASSQ